MRDALAAFDVQTQETSPHAWLHLPEPWRGAAFARACRQRGVGVLPADAFAVGRETLAHAVRINVGAAPSFGVYLNLPSGDDPQKRHDLYALTLSTFGLVESSQATESLPDSNDRPVASRHQNASPGQDRGRRSA